MMISNPFIRVCLGVLAWSSIAATWGVATAAAATVTVSFSHTPLFVDASVLPGDVTTRTVTITNGTAAPEPISVTSQNTFNTGLADVMNLSIAAAGTEWYTGSFAEFFASPVTSLGQLAPGETKTWTFAAVLPAAVGNAYQDSQFGFDLVIGWSDGTITDTPNGGGGGAGGQVQFRLFNEEIVTIDVPQQSVTFAWNTNLPGTTYLVCGNTAGGSFVLDPAADRFGYQFVVPEDTALTVSHQVVLAGLMPGTYECRPASRPSVGANFTVGLPLSFVIPESEVAGAAFSEPESVTLIAAVGARPVPTGSVLGAQKGTFGGPTYEEWRAELEAARAARAAEGYATTTPTADATSSISDTSETAVKEAVPMAIQVVIGYWWVILVLLVLAGGWYWHRVRS